MYYIGKQGKLEEDLVAKRDYIKFLAIDAPKLPPRKAKLTDKLKWIGVFHKAYKDSIKYIKQNKIDVVMGTGGYVAAPVFCACIVTNTPFLIHNLDSCFGLVNQLFRCFAKRVTLGFPMDFTLTKKYKYTGNPVTKDFIKIYNESDSSEISKNKIEKLVDQQNIKVLISGGSQGSRFINDSVAYIINRLTELNNSFELAGKKISITHVTGNNLFKEHLELYLEGDAKKYKNYKVLPYSHDMAELCRDADIAICRAGAMTCAEMSMAQCIPIFFPLPWAANNHQMKNALNLNNHECAYLIQQDQENTQKSYTDLYNLLSELFKEEDILLEKKKKLKRFAKPLASKEILDFIKEIISPEALP